MNAAYRNMKTIVVMGMHRSATSLVAKGLHHEIFMGDDLMPANASNPQGYYESLAIVRLNDAILHAAGGNWRKPPKPDAILAVRAQFDEQIAQLMQQHYRKALEQGYELCGFKDPRLSLTIKLWQPHLINAHYVGVWRSPVDIARSLQKREGMSLDEGIALATYYQQQLHEFL